MSQVPLTFGGGNKNLVEGCTGGGGGGGGRGDDQIFEGYFSEIYSSEHAKFT